MKRNHILWGSILVFLGLVTLLQNLGNYQIWKFSWPILVILIGGWLIYKNFLPGKKFEDEVLVIPLENAKYANVNIKHGAGRLFLSADHLNENLIDGTFHGGIEKNINRFGDKVDLSLEPASDWTYIPPFNSFDKGFDWNVKFSKQIEYRFQFKTGAGESQFNFTDLNVKNIKLETGASSTRLSLPKNAGLTNLEIHAGAASIEIEVPEQVAARIKIQSGLSGQSIDQNRFQAMSNGLYESPGYEMSDNKVVILIDGGIASFKVY
jgi:hypothetical protein